MRKITVLLFVSLFASSMVQAQDHPVADKHGNMKVEIQQEPHYPKGEQALYQYVYGHLKYPDLPAGTQLKGQIILSFDVLPDSSLVNFVTMQSLDKGIDKSIIEILKNLKFAPSIQNGIPVKMNVMLAFPITKHYFGDEKK
jgi:hypothetical protein